VPRAEIASEDYNCNIRRYVDNAPPPEPHDVRAHLHGGVPITEVESLAHFWQNYAQLRDDAFKPRDESYVDFSDAISDKRAIADFVATHQSVVTKHQSFMQTLQQWWEDNLPIVEALAPDADNQQARPRNVYVMRSSLLQSIETALADQQLLTPFQVRGAFANYVDVLKADFKSIAASGWGAELIPDEDILQSQFPEILEQQEQSQARLADLQSLFASADEEDFEDTEETGVLPGVDVKNKKEELKASNVEWKAQIKQIKDLAANLFTEIRAVDLLPVGSKKGYYCTEGFTQKSPEFSNGQRIIELAKECGHDSEYIEPLQSAMKDGQRAYERAVGIEASLAQHKLLEDEVKSFKATIKGIEGKRDELVQSARAKISNDEARTVIVARLRGLLMDTYRAYLRADQRTCVKALESLWGKYAVTAKSIESDRDEATEQLNEFLVELGYE
jgi:type I restriction enzyme M protein